MFQLTGVIYLVSSPRSSPTTLLIRKTTASHRGYLLAPEFPVTGIIHVAQFVSKVKALIQERIGDNQLYI